MRKRNTNKLLEDTRRWWSCVALLSHFSVVTIVFCEQKGRSNRWIRTQDVHRKVEAES